MTTARGSATTRRWPRATAALAAAGLALTGCGDGAPADGDGATDAVTTLRFLLFGGPEERDAYERVAAAYEATGVDVDVQIDTVASQDDLMARLTTSFAGGTPPDVFLINFRRYGQFVAEGAITEVQQFVDDSTVIDLDDYYPEPLEAFRFDGENLTCLPQNISSLVTYVNVDLFDAAGLDVPYDGMDWNELVETATALTDADNDVYGLGTRPSIIRLAPMVWSTGADLVDDPANPTRLVLDEFPASAALEFLLDLSLEHGVVPPDVAEQARGSRDRFLDGDLAMFWSSRREVPTFRTITDFTWDVVPFPIAPGGFDVTMLHADAFCLPAGLATNRAAWQFVEFASTPQGQAILAETGRTVPSRIDVAESDAFLRDDVPPANARVFLDNARIVRATPSTATWNEAEGLANDILEGAFYGRITRAEALRRLGELRLDGG